MAIKRLEENPRLVAFAETLPGRLVLVGAFALIAQYGYGHLSPQIGLVLAALSIWPSRRRLLVAIASAYFLLRWPPFDNLTMGGLDHPRLWRGMDLRLGFVAAILIFAWLALRLLRKDPDHWLIRRPARNILVLFGGMLVAASVLPMPGRLRLCLWGLLAVGRQFIWFIAYALVDRKGARQRSPLFSVLGLQPFWCPYRIPFTKGEANLDHFEAKDAHELAISQLRGLELLLGSVALILTYNYFHMLIGGSLWPVSGWLKAIHVPMPVPSIEHAVTMYLKGSPLPRSQCWLAAIANFTTKMLWVFGFGGALIATGWMAGFRVLRNSDKALRSRTIAEFYNRYYYYFKELLVNFFFYPTFFRYFKKWPKMRIFFATFAAAGFGNAVFHFTQNLTLINEKGLWRAMLGFRVYLFYTVVLGTSIGLSQLRSMNKAVRPPGRFTGPMVVLVFYCVIMIMDIQYTTWSIRDVSCFILNLFIPFSR